jgi:hypothetical protein
MAIKRTAFAAIAKALKDNWQEPRDEWDFGLPDREKLWQDASYDTWARAPFWSADECAALALGKDPGQISGLAMELLYGTARFGSRLKHIYEEILKAQANKELHDRIRPVEFLAWAKEKKIHFPDQLEVAVSDNEADVVALQRRNKKLRDEIQKLRYQQDRLRGANPPQPKEPPTELSLKERRSLHRLVVGMAVAGYRWDPKAARSPVPKEIAHDLKKHGLDLDQDTVLKYLREAAGEESPKTNSD